MVPVVGSIFQKNQECQNMDYDRGVRVLSFGVGDAVIVQNFNGSSKWIPGRVIETTGLLSFTIQLDNGVTCG